MREQVIEHIQTLFKNYNELAKDLPESLLVTKIDIPTNKSLGEHLWCITGARESYALAIKKGEWSGFSCTLTKEQIGNKAEVIKHLSTSAGNIEGVLEEASHWDKGRLELLLNLLEHETMHEGQIIRLVYGLKQELPQSWIDRWA